MAFDLETKDCTALSDIELSDMADIAESGDCAIDIGFLSKEREEWVLVTQAFEKGKIHGFSMCTLERIGGTPSLLIGVACLKRNAKRESVLKAMMADQYRRALLAFPDEDVLVGTRLIEAGGFDAFRGLGDIVPRPGHKATGEERAWGRRLAKRFGCEGKLDDRTFKLVASDARAPGGLDYTTTKPEKLDTDVVAYFKGISSSKGERLVAFGWAMAEDLASGKLMR